MTEEQPAVLSPEQHHAFVMAQKGKNLFISGPGGTGKSFLLEQIRDFFEHLDRYLVLTASTGVAAVNVGGRTIHSALKTGIKGSVKEILPDLENTYKIRAMSQKFAPWDALVIDEVSMLSGDYLDMADLWLRRMKGSDAPFGGLQVLFVGDFLQLPPVEKDKTPRYRFAFQAPAWEKAKVATVELKKSFRQEDQQFVDMLNRIRRGETGEEILEFFNAAVGRELEDPTRLVPTNREADAINEQHFARWPGHEKLYRAELSSKGKYGAKYEQQLGREALAPVNLRLKEGVPVLLLKNGNDGAYVNGDRGRVTELRDSGITVELERTGEQVDLRRQEWEKLDGGGRRVATMRQYPVRLAWAMTIHKSQGMTLDRVQVDLSKVFAAGQTYVALSRLRRLEGLSLTAPLRPQQVFAERAITDFYTQQSNLP